MDDDGGAKEEVGKDLIEIECRRPEVEVGKLVGVSLCLGLNV